MKTPENNFKHKEVVPALKKLDKCWFFLNESYLSIRGLPDIVGLVNGRFFAWEIKKSAAEATKKHGRNQLQGWVLNTIRSCGGIARFVYPENIQESLEELQRLL